jgi:hypothetical protein
MNDVLEVLKIAKSKNGTIGKDRAMLDEKRRLTFGYVNNNSQIVEVKIPVYGVEIDQREYILTVSIVQAIFLDSVLLPSAKGGVTTEWNRFGGIQFLINKKVREIFKNFFRKRSNKTEGEEGLLTLIENILKMMSYLSIQG